MSTSTASVIEQIKETGFAKIIPQRFKKLLTLLRIRPVMCASARRLIMTYRKDPVAFLTSVSSDEDLIRALCVVRMLKPTQVLRQPVIKYLTHNRKSYIHHLLIAYSLPYPEVFKIKAITIRENLFDSLAPSFYIYSTLNRKYNAAIPADEVATVCPAWIKNLTISNVLGYALRKGYLYTSVAPVENEDRLFEQFLVLDDEVTASNGFANADVAVTYAKRWGVDVINKLPPNILRSLTYTVLLDIFGGYISIDVTWDSCNEVYNDADLLKQFKGKSIYEYVKAWVNKQSDWIEEEYELIEEHANGSKEVNYTDLFDVISGFNDENGIAAAQAFKTTDIYNKEIKPLIEDEPDTFIDRLWEEQLASAHDFYYWNEVLGAIYNDPKKLAKHVHKSILKDFVSEMFSFGDEIEIDGFIDVYFKALIKYSKISPDEKVGILEELIESMYEKDTLFDYFDGEVSSTNDIELMRIFIDSFVHQTGDNDQTLYPSTTASAYAKLLVDNINKPEYRDTIKDTFMSFINEGSDIDASSAAVVQSLAGILLSNKPEAKEIFRKLGLYNLEVLPEEILDLPFDRKDVEHLYGQLESYLDTHSGYRSNLKTISDMSPIDHSESVAAYASEALGADVSLYDLPDELSDFIYKADEPILTERYGTTSLKLSANVTLGFSAPFVHKARIIGNVVMRDVLDKLLSGKQANGFKFKAVSVTNPFTSRVSFEHVTSYEGAVPADVYIKAIKPAMVSLGFDANYLDNLQVESTSAPPVTVYKRKPGLKDVARAVRFCADRVTPVDTNKLVVKPRKKANELDKALSPVLMKHYGQDIPPLDKQKEVVTFADTVKAMQIFRSSYTSILKALSEKTILGNDVECFVSFNPADVINMSGSPFVSPSSCQTIVQSTSYYEDAAGRWRFAGENTDAMPTIVAGSATECTFIIYVERNGVMLARFVGSLSYNYDSEGADDTTVKIYLGESGNIYGATLSGDFMGSNADDLQDILSEVAPASDDGDSDFDFDLSKCNDYVTVARSILRVIKNAIKKSPYLAKSKDDVRSSLYA